MHNPEALLRSIGAALLDEVGTELENADDKLLAALPNIARSVWRSWAKARKEAERRSDLEALVISGSDENRLATAEIAADVPLENLGALVPASSADIHITNAEIADEIASARTTATRHALAAYLDQVPAGIRQWLRRPSDPTASSIPAQLALRQPDDLLAFLPTRLARFQAGDTPLAGAGWYLNELLGINEYSETWRARRAESEGATALLKFFTMPWAGRVLRNEAVLLDRILLHGKHPSIVPLRQIYLSAEPACLEYDYVASGDLAGAVREWQMLQRRPTPAQIAQIVLRLAKTLAFSHRSTPPLVHRALKPANILVQSSADGRLSFRIADFGAGVVTNSHAVRQALKGASAAAARVAARRGGFTALYASPQQLRGVEPGPRDDVYALGVIWYQLLTADLTVGRPLNPRWRQYLVEQGSAEVLVDLLANCFDDNPENRPRDAGALANQIASILNIESDSPAGLAARPAPQEDARLLERRIVNSIGISLALLPAATFKMGSPPSEAERGDDEGPQHDVALTRPFYMGIHPVTQHQFETVRGYNPSYFQGSKGGAADLPVENISWDEAVAFCRNLSDLAAEKAAGHSYRLPTEAEWEYACRAGQSTPFASGLTLSSREANFNGNYPYGRASRGPYLERTSAVGSYPPNPFGLYDMHGNVWEWCSDFYDRHFYRHSPRFDPQGPPTGNVKVVRGGSCYNIGRFCRSAYRFGIAPGNRDLDVGMRVIMEVKSQE